MTAADTIWLASIMVGLIFLIAMVANQTDKDRRRIRELEARVGALGEQLHAAYRHIGETALTIKTVAEFTQQLADSLRE